MTRDLTARVAAAQAAARADTPERCEWCGAPDDVVRLTLARYEHRGIVMECEDDSLCRARVRTVVRPPEPVAAPQTPVLALVGPDSVECPQCRRIQDLAWASCPCVTNREGT